MTPLIDIVIRVELGLATGRCRRVEDFFAALGGDDRSPAVLCQLAIVELSLCGWPEGRLEELLRFIRTQPSPDEAVRGVLNRRYEEQILRGQRPHLSEYDSFRVVGLILRSEDDPFQLGETVCGQFRLTRRIGAGGFGVVFEAENAGGPPVAVKTLRVSGPVGKVEQARALLAAEARAIRCLNHPSFPAFVGWVEDWNGYPCLITELVWGKTLVERLATGKMEPADAARVIRDIAVALYHVHSRGLLHRDLTPTNVVLRPDGRVVLLDFGLAVREEELLQREGEVAGTLGHQSPDTILGMLADLDARSDVWCLGQLLRQCLTGKATFSPDGREDALVQAIVAAVLPREPNGFPEDLQGVVQRCLQANPLLRYDTALDVAEDLDAYLGRSDRGEIAARRQARMVPLAAFRVGNQIGEVQRHLDAFCQSVEAFQNAAPPDGDDARALLPSLFMANEEARNVRILLANLGVAPPPFEGDESVRKQFYRSGQMSPADVPGIHDLAEGLAKWLNDAMEAAQAFLTKQPRSAQAMLEFGLVATLPRSVMRRPIDIRRIAPLTELPQGIWEPYASFLECRSTLDPADDMLRLLIRRVERHYLYSC